ncbi:MAG: FAD-dependent oxidoreductase [Sandaracinus sp.]|nr:FAD-dependent oxidoreductase [Sandaracinus sp.]
MLLEARDRLGGRTCTVDLLGHAVDVGGQWIGPTQKRAHALARRLGIATYEQHHRGAKVVRLGAHTATYRGLLPRTAWNGGTVDDPRIGPRQLLSLGRALAHIELAALRLPVGDPWDARHAAKHDALSVEEWLTRHVGDPVARRVLAWGVNAVFACEPRDLSFSTCCTTRARRAGFSRCSRFAAAPNRRSCTAARSNTRSGSAKGSTCDSTGPCARSCRTSAA